ncbi:MAG: 50S ribosomal protein L7Ae [Candidatus Micrarchaeaceae archaeon]
MAKSYVKFQVSKEVSEKTLEAIRLAKQNGSVKKGINEVTKSVERNLATLVVIAEDVEPEEVVMHIPTLCEQKKIAFVYVPTKQEIGNAVGINVPCSAIAIEKAGNGEQAVKEVIAKISGKSASELKATQKPEAKKEAKPEKPKPQKAEKEAQTPPAA